MKKLAVDSTKCTGCRYCEMACSAKREGVYNPQKARVKTIRYGLPEQTVLAFCRQCKKPACLESCPVGAMRVNELIGAVVVDEAKCIGCGICVEACPIPGAISMHPEKSLPLKCDLCDGDPECVKYCVPQALKYEGQGNSSNTYKAGKKTLLRVLKEKGLTPADVLLEG